VRIGDMKEFYVGDEALEKRRMLRLKYPIQQGCVTNFDDVSLLWKEAFENKLKLSTEERCVLLTEPVGNPNSNRENMTQIMFEGHNVTSLCLACEAPLALQAAGSTTGLVINSGATFTSIVSVDEGIVISDSSRRLNFGGNDLTEYLMRLLSERGFKMTAF